MSIFEYDEEAHLNSERKIWREEGVQAGMAAGLQLGITLLLEKFGEIPDSLRARLESETDTERLSRLHKMAADATDIQQFIDMM